jgi:hypothetical protein
MVPGMLVFSSAAALGQSVLNLRDEHSISNTESDREEKLPLWRRLADTKYSPVTVLSDEAYQKMLQDKLLRIEAEIAIIDDRVKTLKSSECKPKPANSSHAVDTDATRS